MRGILGWTPNYPDLSEIRNDYDSWVWLFYVRSYLCQRFRLEKDNYREMKALVIRYMTKFKKEDKFIFGGISIERIINCIVQDMGKKKIGHIYDLPKQ